MKILLVNPPSEILRQEGSGIITPLGLFYIGAVLEKAGHQVKIVDCVVQNWTNPKKFKRNGEIIHRFDVEKDFWPSLFSEFQPDLIGIANLFAASENICVELAKKLKTLSGEVKIVIGGTNASSRSKFLLRNDAVDFVVRGEGEYALRDLTQRLEKNLDFNNIAGLCYKQNGKLFVAPDYNWVENLDELPFPAYHLLNCSIENYFNGQYPIFFVEKRILSFVTSRGCVRNCVFCSGMKNLGCWRSRSPENVLDELSRLKQTYGIKEISFMDPNIGLHKDRFVKLMNLMKEKKINLKWSPAGGLYLQTFTPDLVKLMRETGCHSVYLAIEHGDERMQKYIGKIVPLEKVKPIVREFKKYGIWVHGNFVVGLPGETEESLESCLDYAKKADLDSVVFFIGTPLPGSRLYEEVVKDENADIGDLRWTSKNIWWTERDPDYLRATVKRFMISFVKFRIISEFKPKNIFWRLKNFRFGNIKVYWKTMKRFLEYLIFR